MKTEAWTIPRSAREARPQRPPPREALRPARGLLIGLAFSAIIWLGLLVLWMAF